MDKLKQIEAFVAVVEKGSLARAALVQNITPVMLGRRIDALEKRLGVKLMHRTTRHEGFDLFEFIHADIIPYSEYRINRYFVVLSSGVIAYSIQNINNGICS